MSRSSRLLSAALLGAALLVGAPVAQGAAEQGVLERAAQVSGRATSAVLLSLAGAGSRVVAVGERGIVLLSDDGATAWSQAAVPVSTTLTAVKFIDAQRGWAVGHAGVVLSTGDAGASWKRQLDGVRAAELALKAAPADVAAFKTAQRLVADGPDKPFLDLHFFDAKRGLVIGAYGLIYGTEDGGASWAPWMARVDNPKGLHLNTLAAQGEQLLIAGEQGLLLHSTDGGRSFTRLSSPYPGSWFAAAALSPGRWLVGGLKGHLYSLDTSGPSPSFSASQVPIPVSLSALSVLRDGRVLALNQAGQTQLSSDQGKTLQVLPQAPGAPATAVLQLPDGRLIATSLRGPRLLSAP